jgi:hypothetical protein
MKGSTAFGRRHCTQRLDQRSNPRRISATSFGEGVEVRVVQNEPPNMKQLHMSWAFRTYSLSSMHAFEKNPELIAGIHRCHMDLEKIRCHDAAPQRREASLFSASLTVRRAR